LLELGSAILASVRHFRANETAELTEEVRQRIGGSYVRLARGVVHYEMAGPAEGRLVVLVAGFSVPFYIWDPIFETLKSAGFRVLRYDQYGRGLSDRPAVRYDIELFDQQLGDLLDGLAVKEPVDLAGVSVGGPMAATFAARHPERVRSLALVDPRSPAPLRLPLYVRAPLVGEGYMAFVRAPTLAAWQPRDFFEPSRFPEWSGKFAQQMRYKGFRRALLSTMRHYLQCDLREDYRCVGRSQRPVIVCWGEHDNNAPDVIAQLRVLMPQAEFHCIERAGHLPQYERPETVGPLLCRFLRVTASGNAPQA
jgi:pimeloyl-ACP methyl ester carboxylesterase